jgi:hypothetical protein
LEINPNAKLKTQKLRVSVSKVPGEVAGEQQFRDLLESVGACLKIYPQTTSKRSTGQACGAVRGLFQGDLL